MARRRKRRKSWGNWRQAYAGIILGAIVIVILGFLTANFLTKRNQQISTGEKTEQPTASQQLQVQQNTYKIQEGDSLSAITSKVYGDENLWPVLARVNQIQNPNLIFPDSTIKLPTKAQAEKIRAQFLQTSYQVQEGDTLFSIAVKMYGDGSKWHLLDKANHVGRLENGNPLIFAGNSLVVPR